MISYAHNGTLVRRRPGTGFQRQARQAGILLLYPDIPAGTSTRKKPGCNLLHFFFVICFLNRFLYIHFTFYSFSCSASFVPCLVNVRAGVQAEVATQVEQETGNRNLKDQVLQPQRCQSDGSLVQRCKANRPCRYSLALPLAETELCYYSTRS